MINKKKIAIISSKGGHLYEILQLNQLFNRYPHFWITFPGKDSKQLLRNEKLYYAYYPESRNIFNFFRNFFLAFKILYNEKPSLLISCGAGIAIPFFIVGKYFFNIKTVYIEPYYLIFYPGLTGKILYPIVDLFLIQHSCQKKWYPKATHWGSLL